MRLMPRLVHPRMEDVTLEAVLHALSDPGRLTIIRNLQACATARDEGLACSVAAPAGMPKATMSNHYAVLRAAGLIRGERHGVQMIHRVRRDEVDARFPGLLDAILAAAGAQPAEA